MDLSKLKAPFPASDIEWRVQQAGEKNGKIWAMVLAYVTNRAIMERLDEVVGPENWKNEFYYGPDGAVLCGLSILCAGEWVTKWDGAENTDIEAVKGGLSGAMKRAGVQWGIGRYLYKLDVTFANITDKGKYSGKIKSGPGYKWFKWDPPALPSWALPQRQPQHTPAPQKPTGVPSPASDSPQMTAEQMAKELADRINACKSLPELKNAWTKYSGRLKQMPDDMVQALVAVKDTKKKALTEALKEKK